MTPTETLRRRLDRAVGSDRGVNVAQEDVQELLHLRLEVVRLRREVNHLLAERKREKLKGQ